MVARRRSRRCYRVSKVVKEAFNSSFHVTATPLFSAADSHYSLYTSGVLKTEIDPLQPKVTVVGNVDPKILIKRLQRCGKQAEIWSSGNQSSGKQNKETDLTAPLKEKEREKSQSGWEQAKCCDSSVEKSKESTKGGDGGESKESKKEQKEPSCCDNTTSTTGLKMIKNESSPLPPQVNFTMHPSMLHETGNFRPCTQHCCMVEPCAITLPYYAVHSYTAPAPTIFPTCCSQGLHNLGRPVLQPQLQTPVAHVEDYFSVENTVGCRVM